MIEKINGGDKNEVGATFNAKAAHGMEAPFITYDVVCIGADGKEKWKEQVRNTVTTVGKTDIVDKYLNGSAYTAAFYLLLKGTGSVSASDTLASHSGWSELTPYSGNRPAITWGTTTAGSNTATAVSIAITGTATVYGAGVCTVNTGSSGTLYSAADFSVARGVASGDTLNVTPTISVS